MSEVFTDISKYLKITSRRGDTFNLEVNVNSANGSAYDFTDHVVTWEVYTGAGDRSANLSFASGSGLTLSTGLISLTKSIADMSPLRRGARIHFLRVTFPDGSKKLWVNGDWVVNEGTFGGSDNNAATLTINSSGDVVELTVGSVSGANLPLTIEEFDEELQFNHDKELDFEEGGTLDFTLAASGNINGMGIILKLNLPVSVDFSADFEASPSSQDFDVTKMNLTTLIYFSDYDGQGNEKVIYNNIQLTAI